MTAHHQSAEIAGIEDDDRPVDLNALIELLGEEIDNGGEAGIWGDYGPSAAPLNYLVRLLRENADIVKIAAASGVNPDHLADLNGPQILDLANQAEEFVAQLHRQLPEVEQRVRSLDYHVTPGKVLAIIADVANRPGERA